MAITAALNGGLLVVADLAGIAAGGLESLDNVHRLLVSNIAEDDVLLVEPASDNCGDEELGTVAIRAISRSYTYQIKMSSYVLGPALAMESRPGVLCLRSSFLFNAHSSLNFSP